MDNDIEAALVSLTFLAAFVYTTILLKDLTVFGYYIFHDVPVQLMDIIAGCFSLYIFIKLRRWKNGAERDYVET
jgi:hypothetical protein